MSSRKISPPNPEYYRRAAEIVSRYKEGPLAYSCNALSRSIPRSFRKAYLSEYKYQYWRMFGPRTAEDWNSHGFWNLPATPDHQLQRSLALLFMAEMCENP